MMIRKATEKDIDRVEKIYNAAHTTEETGNKRTGWIRGIYPVRETAEIAQKRGELFVIEADGKVCGTGIINNTQVDCYEGANWEHDVPDNQICVLHTLVIDPECSGRGYGNSFVAFYESFARQTGCVELRIDTNEINSVARRMYIENGFKEIGIVPTEFNGIPGINLVLLEKYIG